MARAEQDDVAAILERLRQEVRAARAAQGDGEAGTALGALERELHHCAEQLEITRVVSAHWPLEGGSLYERAWALVHKVVRRGLSWYIPPIVEQQNAFNEAAARAIRLLIESQAELRDQVAELRRAGEAARAGSREPGDGENEDREARAREAAAPEVAASPPPPGPRLREAAAELEARATVSAHWGLGGPTAVARARGLAQRAVRQYLRWMVNPIVEQQNAANAAIAGAVPHLAAADAELRARAAALSARDPRS